MRQEHSDEAYRIEIRVKRGCVYVTEYFGPYAHLPSARGKMTREKKKLIRDGWTILEAVVQQPVSWTRVY